MDVKRLRVPGLGAAVVALLLGVGASRPVEAQGIPGSRAGFGLFWGSLCVASECVNSVNGAGGSLAWDRDLNTRVGVGAEATYWYGSTRDVTVKRATLLVTGRVYPAASVPAFVKAGGGLSWDLDDPSTNLAGVLGVGWEVRDLIGATIVPFLDAAFFGPPDPLPNLRLVSGGVAVMWPM